MRVLSNDKYRAEGSDSRGYSTFVEMPLRNGYRFIREGDVLKTACETYDEEAFRLTGKKKILPKEKAVVVSRCGEDAHGLYVQVIHDSFKYSIDPADLKFVARKPLRFWQNLLEVGWELISEDDKRIELSRLMLSFHEQARYLAGVNPVGFANVLTLPLMYEYEGIINVTAAQNPGGYDVRLFFEKGDFEEFLSSVK